MKVRPPVKEYDPFAVTQRIDEFWAETHAYVRTKNSRNGRKKYYFVDGPPFTSGKCHLGLARNKLLKDCHIRFMGAQGVDVFDRPGFDMQGLPVEVSVEKALGISYKTQIEEIGVETFIKECMNYANDNLGKMVKQFKQLGIWMEWDNPYLTADNSYIESVWWTIKEAHKKNFLQKQKRVTSWCPRCESPLTKGEIRYLEREDYSAYLKIPIKGRRDEYMIVWTTSPWTFAGALAIAVNPDYTYARVAIRQSGRKGTIIVLESQVESIAKIADIEAYEILESVKGSELESLEFFHPLMADIKYHRTAKGDWCHKILLADSVYEGQTGTVYISPGFGSADYKIGESFGLPVFSPVDERGVFTAEVGMKYVGQGTDEANESILADMRALRFVLKDHRETHKSAHCWRCNSAVIHRATEQWFLKADDISDAMTKSFKGVNWTPDCLGRSVHKEALQKANDWCISRQRFWGTPLPIWECIADVCGHIEVVGTLRELDGANGYEQGMNLHKPWIDSVSIECPKCGGLMKRVPDIIDVWFDSSIASWGQLGYPRKKQAFKELWPGDWVSESQEQTKGWFFNQIFAGIVAFQKVPFRKALAHGCILDEKGHPMQHSSSEYSDVNAAVALHGVDALRLCVLGMDPCENVAFNPDNVREAHRVLNVLWNSYVFCSNYMSMDGWDYREHAYPKIKARLRAEDEWLLSSLETLNNDVKREMERTRPDLAVSFLRNFIMEDLSRCYIKAVRERVWKEGASADKDALYFTLREALVKLSILASPFVPYVSEYIYQELDGTELTVSMVPWPEIDAARVSDNAKNWMRHARAIINASHALRQKQGIGLRWPVRKLTVSASSEDVVNAVKMFDGYIKQQVHASELEIVPEDQEWAGQELIVVPNPNIIGKAYKQRESKIARMLQVLPAKDIKAKIEEGEYSLGIEGEMIRILPDMVQFITKLPDGVVSMEFGQGIIYLDVTSDDELMSEGYAREIIRRIQQMRGDMKLDPEEFIRVRIKMDEGLIELLDQWFENIADSTRASQMEIVEDVEEEDYIIEWPIKEENVLIGVTSLNIKKAMAQFTAVREVDNELSLAIVEAGITNGDEFLNADREEMLKIPGMNHSRYRKIKEYFETPPENRKTDLGQICNLCHGTVEPGSVVCQRCGKSTISDEKLIVVPMFNIYEEEEEYYHEPAAREKVRIERKNREVVEAQPEDEIIKMATEIGKKPRPEDMIASEIMSGISAEAGRERPAEPVKEAAQPKEIAESLHEDVHIMTGAQVLDAMTQEPEIEIADDQDAPDESGMETADAIETPEAIVQEPDAEISDETENTPEEMELAQEPEAEPLDEETWDDEVPMERDSKSDIIGTERDRAISQIAETYDIKHSAAKALYNSGYTSPESLAHANEDELRDIKGIGKITARRVVQKTTSGETKMCSLCNALVPISSDVCTRCGVAFLTKPDTAEPETEEKVPVTEPVLAARGKKPSDAALLFSKATTLKDAGKPAEALNAINEAIKIAPDDDSMLDFRNRLESEVTQPSPEVALVPEPLAETNQETAVPGPEELPVAMEVKQKEPSVIQEAIMPPVAAPVPEPDTAPEPTEDGVNLKRSFTYLIPEERSARSYRLFKASIDSGMPGYCVTRTFPEKVKERYELGQTPILWLSNVAKEDAVRPKDLEKLSLSLEEFLGVDGGGVILLDGIEYLITNNNFITVLKLIQSLRDQVAINRSILLLSVNPSTMDNHQINLLKREVDSVIE